ncbi:hypothetical protein DCS32_01990 [Dokdonia sp. Dokd-P16]|uniref:hypothetical protein n=1 Tax=Dokdonia sp. Dokd-P16 TaxID=2173169 RepID=UPI000D546A97|nr:hypothetical protein [Dokdonia sp. Dokd-P16]AWH72976.1 hypothetical protein DCS32_01990 [Dokdonia sp. Dokd-P16]
MPNQHIAIIYKSQLSTFNVAFIGLGSLAMIGFGIKFIMDTQESGINWFIIFPLIIIFIGGLILSNTLALCSVATTKEFLILNYPFLRRTIRIPWKSITDAGMTFVTTKSSGSDHAFRTGREIRLFADGKNYRFTTISIKNPERLLLELKKRLDSSLKTKMKDDYRKSKSDFWKSENDYRRWIKKVVLPICLIILILLWALSK